MNTNNSGGNNANITGNISINISTIYTNNANNSIEDAIIAINISTIYTNNASKSSI